jgi:hypothetical protein
MNVNFGGQELTFTVTRDSNNEISITGTYDNLNHMAGLNNVTVSAEYKDGALSLTGSGSVSVGDTDVSVAVSYSKTDGISAKGVVPWTSSGGRWK